MGLGGGMGMASFVVKRGVCMRDICCSGMGGDSTPLEEWWIYMLA